MNTHDIDLTTDTANRVLLLDCHYTPQVWVDVAAWLASVGGVIIDADQHTESTGRRFVQRLLFASDRDVTELRESFAAHAQRWQMTWSLGPWPVEPVPTALLGTTAGHCLLDILARASLGEIPIEPVVVVANHDRLRRQVEGFGVPFVHVPVREGEPREAHEARVGQYLADVDLVVLARYMRVLTDGFIGPWAGRMINIHHSFLPAFVGARPHDRAYDRGVKLVGATAHYVTAELDDGPIISQVVVPVSHRDEPGELRQRGLDAERVALASALRAHVEKRVVVVGDRAVVFD